MKNEKPGFACAHIDHDSAICDKDRLALTKKEKNDNEMEDSYREEENRGTVEAV